MKGEKYRKKLLICAERFSRNEYFDDIFSSLQCNNLYAGFSMKVLLCQNISALMAVVYRKLENSALASFFAQATIRFSEHCNFNDALKLRKCGFPPYICYPNWNNGYSGKFNIVKLERVFDYFEGGDCWKGEWPEFIKRELKK